jgi:hypothetical protein
MRVKERNGGDLVFKKRETKQRRSASAGRQQSNNSKASKPAPQIDAQHIHHEQTTLARCHFAVFRWRTEVRGRKPKIVAAHRKIQRTP